MAGGHGGKREGAGRPLKGSRTYAIANRLLERAQKDPDCLTPLDYWWARAMDDSVDERFRLECFKAVAPYFFPRLASIAVTNPESNRLVIEFRDYAKPIVTAITDTKALAATDLAVDAVLNELDQPLSLDDEAAD